MKGRNRWLTLVFATILILSLSLIISGNNMSFAEAKSASYISPLQQYKNGVPLHDIKCREGFQLVVRTHDGFPACVKDTHVLRLVVNGWSSLNNLINANLNNTGIISNSSGTIIIKEKGRTTIANNAGMMAIYNSTSSNNKNTTNSAVNESLPILTVRSLSYAANFGNAPVLTHDLLSKYPAILFAINQAYKKGSFETNIDAAEESALSKLGAYPIPTPMGVLMSMLEAVYNNTSYQITISEKLASTQSQPLTKNNSSVQNVTTVIIGLNNTVRSNQTNVNTANYSGQRQTLRPPQISILPESDELAIIKVALNDPGVRAWSNAWKAVAVDTSRTINPPAWKYAIVRLYLEPNDTAKLKCDSGWGASVKVDINTKQDLLAWYPTSYFDCDASHNGVVKTVAPVGCPNVASNRNTVPSVPQNLTPTSASSSTIMLMWGTPASDGGCPVTGYKIERSTDGGSTWTTIVANTANTPFGYTNIGLSTGYTDDGLKYHTNYTYRVSAINSVGTSLPSITSATTWDIAPLQLTGLIVTTISSSQIDLSWNPPSSPGPLVSGYMIERSSDGGNTWSTIGSNTGSMVTTYSDTGLSPSTAYSYRISAINEIGSSTPSNAVSTTTQTANSTISANNTNK